MIDQSSDSRKTTEITFHNSIILVTFMCLLVRKTFVGSTMGIFALDWDTP